MIRPLAARFRRWFLGDRLWRYSRPPSPERLATDPVALNLKNAGRRMARDRLPRLEAIDVSLEPRPHGLGSKVTTQEDVESPWFVYWCRQLGIPAAYHRKSWEFAFLMQVLFERGRLRPGASGVGFGCGSEPVASWLTAHGVEATVTDLDPALARGRGWMETGQHATALELAFKPALVDRPTFERLARFEYVDMNALPSHLDGRFDFCWSVCAMEHLGSIEAGLRFVEASLRTLRPGGIAVHTTEFNYLCHGETVESGPTVLFLARHLEALKDRVEKAGHRVGSLDFRIGDGDLDHYIDLPPYDWQGAPAEALVAAEAHLKLAVDGYPVTCFGLVVERGGAP
jgi:SAM-dependent methyltransferase